MIPQTDKPRDLLRRLGTGVVPAEHSEQSRALRAKVVGRLEQLVQRESQRNRRIRALRPTLFAALLLAALLVAVLGWGRLRSAVGAGDPSVERMIPLAGTVTVLRSGQSVASSAEVSLRGNEEVRTSSDGRARLHLEGGAVVSVAEDSLLRVHPALHAERGFILVLGRVEVEVPPLGARRFVVVTPQARVVVHGTKFVVEVRAPVQEGIVPTKVRVLEGRVGVELSDREILLEAGATWSNAVQEPSPARSTLAAPEVTDSASAKTPAAAATAVPTNAVQDNSASAAASGVAGPRSTLAEENRLFQSALDARRRGDDEEAVRQLDLLLARYPRTTLAQEARVERFRCLKRLGRGEAAANEARKYLAEHPEGFAREEARGVALPAPSPSGTR